jgi:hypothetical protein
MVSTNLAGILADDAFIVARGGCSDAVGGRSAVRQGGRHFPFCFLLNER